MVSLNNVTNGDSANSSCIQQIVDALKGTAGAGNVPISLTAINDSANFALDVKNSDPTNQRTFRAQNSSGQAVLQVDNSGPQADPTGSGLAPIVNTNGTQTLTNKTVQAVTVVLLGTAGVNNKIQPPSARVTHGSTQTIANGVLTYLNFNTNTWDNDNLHTINSSVMVPSRAGLWSIGASVEFKANSSGYRAVTINQSGNLAGYVQLPAVGGGISTILNVNIDQQLSTSDTIKLGVEQNSGGNLGISTSLSYGCQFWMTYRGST